MISESPDLRILFLHEIERDLNALSPRRFKFPLGHGTASVQKRPREADPERELRSNTS